MLRVTDTDRKLYSSFSDEQRTDSCYSMSFGDARDTRSIDPIPNNREMLGSSVIISKHVQWVHSREKRIRGRLASWTCKNQQQTRLWGSAGDELFSTALDTHLLVIGKPGYSKWASTSAAKRDFIARGNKFRLQNGTISLTECSSTNPPVSTQWSEQHWWAESIREGIAQPYCIACARSLSSEQCAIGFAA